MFTRVMMKERIHGRKRQVTQVTSLNLGRTFLIKLCMSFKIALADKALFVLALDSLALKI